MDANEIQTKLIVEKMKLVMFEIADNIRDNDEAVDAYKRDPEPMEYQQGFEFCAPAWLSYYWSTGTGTPMHDKLIEQLQTAAAESWAEQYPDRPSIDDIMTGDDESEFRHEAEDWEQSAFEDEAIYIQVECVRSDGDIKFTASFTNEINYPLAPEFEIEFTDNEFLALDGEALEGWIKQIAEAPYQEKTA